MMGLHESVVGQKERLKLWDTLNGDFPKQQQGAVIFHDPLEKRG